ncbi:MAG: tetratricopeptide repeat protein [Pyrinomonadaceae bacterium]
MRLLRQHLALASVVLACAPACLAQSPGAPNVIQFYMPDGSMPRANLRFTLTRDDGRVETLFTDSKGKYSMTRDLVQAVGYTVYVEGDRQSYDSTTYSFRILRVNDSSYYSVFLRALKSPPVPRAGVVDAAALDANVPEAARAAYEEGMGLVVKGQAEAGIESLKRAVSLYPQYLRALNDLGVVYLQLNRLDEAADAFTRALKVNSRFSYARLNLGVALNRQGKHAEAAQLLGRLFKENPTLGGARVSYADALYDAGQLAEAGKVLRSGLDDILLKDGEKADLHYRLGRVLSREEKFEDAISELRRALALQPTAYNAHLLLGGDLLRLNRLPEAERALLRAYELGGGDAAHAQLMLGQLYFTQKRYDLALRAFEQYLADAPAAQNAPQIREVVAKLKVTPPKQ